MFDTLTYEELISIAGRRIDKKHSEKVSDDYWNSLKENIDTHGFCASEARDMRDRLIDYQISLIGEATATIKKAKRTIKNSKALIASLETNIIDDADEDAWWESHGGR